MSYLSIDYISINHSIYPPIYLSAYLYINLSIYQPIYLLNYLSTYISIEKGNLQNQPTRKGNQKGKEVEQVVWENFLVQGEGTNTPKCKREEQWEKGTQQNPGGGRAICPLYQKV